MASAPDKVSDSQTTMADPPRPATARDEGRFHNYITSVIPWYIHVVWISFWVFAISYFLMMVIPAVKIELVNPP